MDGDWVYSDDWPGWVPAEAQRYLDHTHAGRSIRALARDSGAHASTVLRQIRRLERLRDDHLVDQALHRLGEATLGRLRPDTYRKDSQNMTLADSRDGTLPDPETLEQESRRVLRRLSEPGACLAVAKDMEKAVVARDTAEGKTVRTAVVDRAVAETMALREWIAAGTPGRVTRYRITPVGRAAMKRITAAEAAPEESATDPEAAQGFAEAPAAFAAQHRDMERPGTGPKRQRPRYNMAESPLVALARRKEKDGAPFLTDDLVAAGERLREDFEIAQMGPKVAQNWERFLTAGIDEGRKNAGGGGSDAARRRVAAALSNLGPGLGDVVLRCCCFLEGLEATERRMGWSARSGKIVLRIALQRLKRHYDETEGGWSPLIG